MRVVWYLCHRELQLTAQLQQKKANDRGDTAQLIIIYYKYDKTINLIIFSTNSFKNKKTKTSTQGGRTINCRRKYINQGLLESNLLFKHSIIKGTLYSKDFFLSYNKHDSNEH